MLRLADPQVVARGRQVGDERGLVVRVVDADDEVGDRFRGEAGHRGRPDVLSTATTPTPRRRRAIAQLERLGYHVTLAARAA